MSTILYTHDPYDIWSQPFLGKLKLKWTNNSFIAKILLPFIGAFEYLAPNAFRKILSTKKYSFAHIDAMYSMVTDNYDLNTLKNLSNQRINKMAWGLPFSWYSKNGVYDANTPYITNTPYVMSALLVMAQRHKLYDEAMSMFFDSWNFLESLNVMYENDSSLALSYSPKIEKRIVINANAYAAFAYSLHAIHGKDNIRENAMKKATRLVNWIVQQQQKDGSWFYYADIESGNFIDSFHSCFVIKNLVQIKRLLPDTSDIINLAVNKGFLYIRNNLYDSNKGLCKRFSVQPYTNPFRWDLYDQAEFLGLLVDFNHLEEAKLYSNHIKKLFYKDKNWYCRIDIFGRLWGKGFMRWGIVPFLYHRNRLKMALEV